MVTFAVVYQHLNMRNKTILTLLNAINPFYWITTVRNKAFDKEWLHSFRFDIPTICIGNITVGGTGKTPHTEYLINLLKQTQNVAVLSRGYGRKSKGYIKADADCTMESIGDEPFQMKKKFPDITVAVCEKRAIGINNLLNDKEPPNVILLDDAYQHRHVSAGLNILLVDSNRPIWSDCQLPFGRLREDSKGAGRADVVIFTKCDENMPLYKQKYCKEQIKAKDRTPIFFSTVKYGEPYPIFTESTRHVPIKSGSKILLLTGIANPMPIKEELIKRGADVILMQFPDHHNFTTGDFEKVAKRFKQIESGERIIITTEKDATRIVGHKELPKEIKEHIYALPIEVSFLNNEKNMFNQIIFDYVTENSRDSRVSKE